MDDTNEKMNTGQGKKLLNPFAVKKPKKRSLVERELETNMTARITLPATEAGGFNTSRYGRARRQKNLDDNNISIETLKSSTSENTPSKQSPMRQSTANKSDRISFKTDTKKAFENSFDKIDNIYEENKNLSRFNTKYEATSLATRSPKVYVQKDLIQNRDDDDDIVLIKDLFSPKGTPKSNRKRMKPLQSSEKTQSSSKKQNGHVTFVDNASVVKALDFDENKADFVSSKQDNGNKNYIDGNKNDSSVNKRKKEEKPAPDKLFEIEAASPYQMGDLAWARMGTFPFWPCIITRDPASNMFVRKKLFGRVEHNILHVTFFADNGRRSWVVDNMLRSYKGLDEFVSTREKFTVEDKKKDPRLYAAFFISDKKQSLWDMSVKEAEMINREPKRTRVDVFYDALYKSRESKKRRSGKVCNRNDSDVSLSESLYDSLFSEDDSKADSIRTRNRSKNRSLDVSEIVTACLDNMAAKTGNIKIQRQSHMDRWLQKAKSKTPEKVKTKNDHMSVKVPIVIAKVEPVDNLATPKVQTLTPTFQTNSKVEKPEKNNKKKKLPPKEIKSTKVYCLRRSYESQNSSIQQSENKSNDITGDNQAVQVTDAHVTRNEITKNVVGNNTENDLNSIGQPQQIQNNNSDEAMEVANVSDDNSTTENRNQTIDKKISTPETVSENGHFVTIEIKPEVMDVDVDHESDVQVAVKPSSATETVFALDSPVKIEKESSITDLLENSSLKNDIVSTNTLNSVSPVKIESPVEAGVSMESDTKSTQENIKTANKSTITHEKKSSPLKNNEMVLIPENITLTDDESNSLTSFDESKRKSVDEHNKTKHTLSERPKIDEVDLVDKTLINDGVLVATGSVTFENSVDRSEEQIKKTDKPNENDMSLEENADKDVSITGKDLLHRSGDSALILRIDNEKVCSIEKYVDDTLPAGNGLSPNNSQTENVMKDNFEASKNKKRDTTNPFLDDSRNIDCLDSVLVNREKKNHAEDMNKPLDLTPCQKVSETDQAITDYSEDSDDEPSPEFEPLEEEIKEDFRQHMMCIESNITDRKDDEQLVKVCNDIAVLEETKFKVNDIKSNTCVPSDVQSLESKEGNNTTLNDEKVLSELSLESDTLESSPTTAVTQNKAEILSYLKSPPDKKRHKLSLKRDKLNTSFNECDASKVNENIINPMYKTIDQIEEIIKSKPKKLPIENGEVCIPGIVNTEFKKEISTPEIEDIDFDIDNASVSSEDSEISLPHNNIPARRSLRSKPERKVGLEDPDFLAYIELRQDDLMDEHPDLTRDDIVLYLYKTYTYSQNLQPEVKLEETPQKVNQTCKKETPTPPSKKSKKHVQPKNTIENFFREKVNKSTRIERENSEIAGPSESNEQIIPQRETLLVSPVDSGLGNSKDSSEVETPVSRTTNKSIIPKDLTEVSKEIKHEIINETIKSNSPKTPKRLRKKTVSPRGSRSASKMKVKLDNFFDKRVPVVVISPESNFTTKIDNSIDKRVPVVVISPMKEHKAIKRDSELLSCDNKQFETKKANTIVEQNKQLENNKTKEDVSKEANLTVKKNKQLENSRNKQDETKDANTSVERNKIVENSNKTPSVNKTQHVAVLETKLEDTEPESMDSESEVPLRQLRSKVQQDKQLSALKKEILQLKDEVEDAASVSSENEPLIKPKKNKSLEGTYDDPEFLKYVELKQDDLMDEDPHLTQNEITAYLYKTWIYEKNSKSDIQKNDEIKSSNLVKGLNLEPVIPQRKAKRKPKVEKVDLDEIIPKEKPKRKTVSHYYNEELLSDVEDELEVFEIFKTKKTAITVVSKPDSPKKERQTHAKSEEVFNNEVDEICEEINTLDDVELYFKQLVSPKPSVFKGLTREKVCGICEDISNLIKCKGCHGMFHYECVNRVVEATDTEKPGTTRGRKKKRKPLNGRKSNDEHHDVSEENISIEETESMTIDAAVLESELEAKMNEVMQKEAQIDYDSYSSDDGIDWTDTIPGKCEVVDVKLKKRSPPVDISNFKCNNCLKYDIPICFVCKSAISKTGVKIRQRCNVPHCHSYYHLECLDHWPQTQIKAGEWSRMKSETLKQEALTCPRHVCHTCVSDDPRGCKTRFSGDKLAKCVRCPATYHSFNKCLPAGTQILTASFIICPRHYEHRPGKVPCHVNTGWCFICALGGSLICCEYCPTSFHAECLNIKPPEGNYMCEDCETGRLPLYGEMVWVKLGHYRWWPGVILHPSEIPDNIMSAKHGLGEFVVRFFGQYDHYWVNRGRVFPYQEGDSGRVSGQRSKIDAAFTTAMEHAQRAYEILKNAEPDEEESLEINSSLLPPHYVKLKTNKPTGSLLGRKVEDPSLSLTQCECNPADIEPCGPNSQCLNRVLLTECGPTCRAGERCNNRAFEKRQYPKLTPYRASHRGWGLKTLDDIKAGQFVIEYVGELIDEEEFQWRMKRKHEIRDENFYFLTLDKERMIDAGPKGNLARFMNHCCEPNCETQKWTVLGDVRVGLFAIEDIKANSEVTFNYNLECTGIEKKRCMCGAKRCSGYIGAKPKQLDESQRKKHSMTGKRKYTKRKETEDSPSTSKSKTKRPLGRPRKEKPPKELTEIEKDLLIIKSATPNSDESRPPSIEDKKDPNTTVQDAISNTGSKEFSKAEEPIAVEVTKLNGIISNDGKVLKTKLDPNTTEDVRILNGIEPKLQKKIDSILLKESIESKALKRKVSNTVDATDSEPCAKRLKSDKRIEVGD